MDTVFRKRVMELLHQASNRAKEKARKENRVYTSVSDLLTPGHKQARASSAVKRRATLMSNMVDNVQATPVSKKRRLQNTPANSSATSSATPAVTSSATPSNTVEKKKKQKHRHRKSSHKSSHKKKYRLDSSDDLIVD